jgi:predicted RNase H-like nuclease
MQIAGIDLAWKSLKNPTALAIGVLKGGELTLQELVHDLFSVEAIESTLSRHPSLQGIAIDGPLIIKNSRGQRVCETHISQEYGARKAACHTSNLTLYPDSDCVRLSGLFESQGFTHLGMAAGKWQIECYPHPALIEIFGLKERHQYKKGRVNDRKRGQIELARLLSKLSQSRILTLNIPKLCALPFNEEHIEGLSGVSLKRNEDILDAVICIYIAGLYALGQSQRSMETQHRATYTCLRRSACSLTPPIHPTS